MPASRSSVPPTPEERDELDSVPAFLRSRDASAHRSKPASARVAAERGLVPDHVEPEPLDPATLPVATIPSRHLARGVALLVAAWIVVALARQVGDAVASTARVDAVRDTNAAARQELAGLQRELKTISDQRYIDLEARAHGLGGPGEVPFTLQVNAPTLAPDAPGSAAVRLGAADDRRSPLDAWLSILFGPEP